MKRIIILFGLAMLVLGPVSPSFGGSSNITVQASGTVLGGGTISFSITGDPMDFGNMTPQPTDVIFTSNVATVDFVFPTAPWKIQIYTDNQPGNEEGLVGPGGANIAPLKFNNPNLHDVVLDEETEFESKYSFVVTNGSSFTFDFENDVSTPGGVGSRPFHLGVQAAGATTGSYSGTVVFEAMFP